MSNFHTVTAFAAALLLANAAGAEFVLGEGTHQVSVIIVAGDYRAYVIDLGRDDALKVRLSEPTGARIDVFLTNYSAYMVYKNAIPGVSLDFYHLGGEFSAKSVSEVDYTYYSLRADTMVLIVDNTNRTDEGAAGVGAVEVVGTITVSAGFWGFGEMLVVGLVAVAMVAVVVLAFRRKGRARPPARPHEELSARPHARSPAMPPAKQPAPVAPTSRLHPVRKLLRPVKRSSMQKRKPLSPKRGMRGR